MAINKSVILDSLQKGHAEALQEAEQFLPEVKLIDLIEQLCDVLGGKTTKKNAAKFLAEKYRTSFEVYLSAFANIAIEEILKNAKDESIQSMGNPEFSKEVVDTAANIAWIIQGYVKGDLKDEDLISQLAESGLKSLTKDVLDGLGVDTEKLEALEGQPVYLANAMLAYYGFTEAYKILAKAQEDAALQHEETLQIQAACARSISCIKQHRLEMNELVETYLSDHLDTFQSGFQAMDAAIMAGDADGYIKGNVQIQEILHYDIQFRNADEFDSLMDSDESFRL